MRKTLQRVLTIAAAALLTGTQAHADRSWSFTSFSDNDKALCAADTENWALHSDGTRYCRITAISDAALTAADTELAYAEGLRFTIGSGSGDSGKLRANWGSGRLELNGTGLVLTIPDLEAGQTVTVSCKTSSSSTARGLTTTNLTAVSGYFDATTTDEQTNVATVTADGDVTLTTTGGMYVYSITVKDVAEGVSDGSIDLSGYNNTTLDNYQNQVKMLLTSNDLVYYNTAEVSIAIDDEAGEVSITAVDGSFTDVFAQTVERITFTKGAESGTEGEYTNSDGITIIEAMGWLECVYAKWEPFEGAASYDVYVKGGQYSDYTQIDEPLIRAYDGYCRADVPGLTASDDYCLKIVPVDDDGTELAAYANEATAMEVRNYSRAGFAHLDYSGVGAYNDDGSLKDGARIVYVHAGNAKTVTCDVVTSSTGKTTTYTGMQDIIYGYQQGMDTTPITFRIIGMLTYDDMDELLSSSEGLQVKGKHAYSELNITIEGIGDDAVIHGFGILLRNAVSVELRNFAIMNCMDDCVSIDTDNSHLWVHNLDLFYGQTGSDSDQSKGDGTIDIKGDSQYISVSSNRFWDSGKSSLCGMTSETGPNYISYDHNWFDHSDSRHPRVRTMSVHVWNNYFDGVAKYGVGAVLGSSVFVDRNYFRATDKPMMISLQGTDISNGTANATFSGEDGGVIKAYGNVFAEKSSNFKYVTYADDDTEFDAYETDNATDTVPSTVTAKVGGTCYDNFDTDSSLMYSYEPDEADELPSIVTGFYGAGRLNHGDFAYTITGDTDYSVDTALRTAIENYTSQLVSIFGEDYTGSGTTDDGDDDSSTDDGDDTSDDSTTESEEGTILVSFDGSTPSSSIVTVSGNYSTSKGSATYDGVTYTTCVKMESSTEITVNASKAYTMTLVFGDSETASVAIDGTKYTGTGSTYTASIAAGTTTLTKNASVNLFLIALVPEE